VDPRFNQKEFAKLWLFFEKKLRYLKSKISTKFHRLIFLFIFFSIFFSIHLSKLVQKLWNFLKCFIGRVRVLPTISGKF